MLYKKNNTARFSRELFQNPTAEYRGAPFWAWNCKLDVDELKWQLEVFKKMGFGGAHMHVRTGMATTYLSDEYMELIKACVEKAKQEGMLAWLYDEDRWPSGAAGGLVTRDKRFRQRYLLFTPTPHREITDAEDGCWLACYDVELDEKGYLKSASMIGQEENAQFEKWYAYLILDRESPWFNNQTYVNTLDKAAMDKFIDITYEAYNCKIGDDFDKTVPAIFTDEPQFTVKSTLSYATEKVEVTLPWTDDLAETYAQAYGGEDLLAGIPELIWDRADGQASVIRYHYHDHVCERFTEAFADNCGKWCREHGIALTGHMINEDSLLSQTKAVGEVMRSYRGFELPGIDTLCAGLAYTTAKQTQSAVHQYDREGMLSELYGVTNWNFDFRGHKFHGDWQAALGVTVRVPHLSWVSMEGEAKRDYPASIHYQSPWWEQYSVVEDHFARVNTAMTRGKAIVKVGVIHPIESYWLHWGPSEQTALVRDDMDNNFKNLAQWLLFGGIDFDYISESLLPDLCSEGSAPLMVGAMAYDVILVSGCETLRTTTLERLERFVEAGGKLVFAGELPYLENALVSERGAALASKAECVSLSRGAILQAMESARLVEIRNETGALTENLLHQLRQDGEGRWLFISHGTEPYNKDVSKYQDLRIRVAGAWKVAVYNTMNGEIEDIRHCINDGNGENTDGIFTDIYRRMYDYDSLLLWLEPFREQEALSAIQQKDEEDKTALREMELPVKMRYTLSEPNVLLLDQAEYALDDGEWQPKEEILRLDNQCRRQLGWPTRQRNVAQPWVTTEEPVTHTVHLRWRIHSAISYTGAQLAMEDIEHVQLKWNDVEIATDVSGWYVDKSIKTIVLPEILSGENILEAAIPFGKRKNTEWVYILGDFGVEVSGRECCIIPPKEEITFGTITTQGLPFYGGNITYHVPLETKGGKVQIRSSQYKGALQTVSIDGGKEIPMIYPPYTVAMDVPAGKHMVDITLYGHRRNSFGPLHLTDLNESWIGPDAWRSEGEKWSYEYMIVEEGIMTSPLIGEMDYNGSI